MLPLRKRQGEVARGEEHLEDEEEKKLDEELSGSHLIPSSIDSAHCESRSLMFRFIVYTVGLIKEYVLSLKSSKELTLIVRYLAKGEECIYVIVHRTRSVLPDSVKNNLMVCGVRKIL